MAISTMAIFVKNSKNHIKGELVKIRVLILVFIFMIFSQKYQFRVEIENFLGI